MINGLIPIKSGVIQGLTLIELLVSLLLGSLLVLAAVEIGSSNARVFHQLVAMSEVQENGRFSLYFLAADLQMAGHSLDDSVSEIDWSRTLDSGSGALTKDNDEIVLRRISAEKDYNCLGVPVVPGTLVGSHYYVKDDRLICRADYWAYASKQKSGIVKKSTAQTIIEGVDSFQLLYGAGAQKGLPGTEGYTAGNEWVEKYVPADQVDPANHQVLSVRVGVILKGNYLSPDQSNKEMFLELLDRNYAIPKDGYHRQSYESTVLLRNVSRSVGV